MIVLIIISISIVIVVVARLYPLSLLRPGNVRDFEMACTGFLYGVCTGFVTNVRNFLIIFLKNHFFIIYARARLRKNSKTKCKSENAVRNHI